MMSILIAEDEPRINQALVKSLKLEGFVVDAVSTYEDLDYLMGGKTFYPEVIVLDRLLGKFDSINLLKKMRKKVPNAGILILSAISSIGEKALALESGADDYLSKPFSMTELIARVKALERRSRRPPTNQFLSIGNVLLDTVTRTVQIAGTIQTFPNREFLLLRLFMQSPGRIYSKIQIFESVWEMSSDSETNVVEATVNGLRRRLEMWNANLKIRNMRNTGYWIEA